MFQVPKNEREPDKHKQKMNWLSVIELFQNIYGH